MKPSSTAFAGLLVLALLVMGPGAAHAGDTSRGDADDVVSRLDVARVSLSHQGPRIVATLTFRDPVDVSLITGGTRVGVYFKTSDTRVRGVALRHDGTGPSATVCSYPVAGPSSGTRCSRVSLTWPDPTSLRFEVARRKIARGVRTLRWRAETFAFNGAAGCVTTVYCTDHVPDSATRFLTWRL